ncbi:MAG: thymidylate synthase, partial [bacterium]|nr:thymidylate synthase [bacterium]
MKQYLDLVKDVLENGKPSQDSFRNDRTGVGTYAVFGRQMRFNLEEGFPL